MIKLSPWSFCNRQLSILQSSLPMDTKLKHLICFYPLCKSFINLSNKIGPGILPCGIPLISLELSDQDVPNFTLCCLLHKKQATHLGKLPVML